MPKLCRLKVMAEIDGAVRGPGYHFILQDGEQGPHRAVRTGHDRIDVARDAIRIQPEMGDEPLYDVIGPIES